METETGDMRRMLKASTLRTSSCPARSRASCYATPHGRSQAFVWDVRRWTVARQL